LPEIDYVQGDTLRILEAAKQFKIFFDSKHMTKMKTFFKTKNIVAATEKLSMIEMIYPDVLTKTPGVFSVLSSELGSHDISILDALICSNEHIIIIEEKHLVAAFELIFHLCAE
jgi:hypothetical protein